ncbi:MAG: DUF192 domain-containing protein [Bacteriovoracaceae bacterium]|nr:DUF192 domain-containing protein [Bacteriovoracaceae bacterium]
MKLTKGDQVIAEKVKMADTIYLRTVGLMFSKSLDGFDCLWIRPCKSIHTCFMKYPIDVMFLDKKLKIVKIIKNIKPWRVTLMYFTATQCLEFSGGFLPGNLKIGDNLEAVCIN